MSGRRRWRLWLLAIVGSVACGNVKPSPVVAPTPPSELSLSDLPFKRVDRWSYVPLEQPLSRVEQQLKKHFEQVFTRAQYSAAHTCLAREEANFIEQHAALPEEQLGTELMGRCGSSATSSATYRYEIISDGTLLEAGLPEELLAQVSAAVAREAPPFNLFGITARYVGANVIIVLDHAAVSGSVRAEPASSSGLVRVDGILLESLGELRAVVNQGELGVANCEADAEVEFPKYAFECQMAAGDDEAWINISGQRPDGSAVLVGMVPAHRADWEAPAEYTRKTLGLPEHVDTATAILTRINDWRRQLGLKPLTYDADQSAANQPVYEKLFKINSKHDFNGGDSLRQELLRGRATREPILWGGLAVSIAFDGDAADWLSFQMMDPSGRLKLMGEMYDTAAIAVHGEPSVGFGAAVGVYALLTDERLDTFAENMARKILSLRGNNKTELLPTPPELHAAAAGAAAGDAGLEEAFAVALRALNRHARPGQHYMGEFRDFDTLLEASDLLDALADRKALSFGVVPTFGLTEPYGWAHPLGFVWYLSASPPRREADRGHSSGMRLAAH